MRLTDISATLLLLMVLLAGCESSEPTDPPLGTVNGGLSFLNATGLESPTPVRVRTPSERTAARPDHQRRSSLERCYCFPFGDSCEVPDGRRRVRAEPGVVCRYDEWCSGSITDYDKEESPAPRGNCHQPCFHPEAQHPRHIDLRGRASELGAEFDCAAGEECRLVDISGAREAEVLARVGLCFPSSDDNAGSDEDE